MANAGDTIENPLTGERITFLKRAWDTNGELLRLEFICPPRSKGPLEHIHPRMEERFEVVSGTMVARVGRREQRLEGGRTVTIPGGTPHTFWNPGDDELRFLAELRPALNTETLFETYFGLARDGKAFKSGIPKNPLQAAVLAREYGADTCLAGLPMPVYKALLAVISVLASVGGRLGYKARYHRYDTRR